MPHLQSISCYFVFGCSIVWYENVSAHKTFYHHVLFFFNGPVESSVPIVESVSCGRKFNDERSWFCECALSCSHLPVSAAIRRSLYRAVDVSEVLFKDWMTVYYACIHRRRGVVEMLRSKRLGQRQTKESGIKKFARPPNRFRDPAEFSISALIFHSPKY